MPLDTIYKKYLDSGFWPDQHQAPVMLNPRRGDVEMIKTQEIILPVKKL